MLGTKKPTMRSACDKQTYLRSWSHAGRALLIVALLPAAAGAWENICTHPRITSNAVQLLPQTQDPNYGVVQFYSELGIYTPDLKTGSVIEDELPTLGVPVDHFYDPSTRAFLHDGSILDDGALSNIALLGTYFPQQTALQRGDQLWWTIAVNSYKLGYKDGAYVALGRALHLMTQDMTQPAHTHNDPHVPQNYLNGYTFFKGLDGSNASPLEASAETACTNNLPTFVTGTTAAIPTQFPSFQTTPELNIAEGAAEAAYAAATFSSAYDFSQYPILSPGAMPGTIDLEGNPVRVKSVAGRKLPPSNANDCLAADPHWEISGLNGATLCYDPHSTYSGTLASHFTNNWWSVSRPGEPVPWLPTIPGGAFLYYFHNYDEVGYGNTGLTLNAQLQSTMLPLAAEYSAALLEQFAKSVDPIPSTMTVRMGDGNGPQVPTQGFTSNDGVYVYALDPGAKDPTGDARYPTPSGVASLTLEMLDGSGNVTGDVTSSYPALPIPMPTTQQSLSITAEYNFTLPAATAQSQQFQFHAIDGLGNHSYSTFTYTTTQPGLSVTDSAGASVGYGGFPTDANLNVVATKTVAPLRAEGIEIAAGGGSYVATGKTSLPDPGA